MFLRQGLLLMLGRRPLRILLSLLKGLNIEGIL
jgi:hypothetical protein